MLYHIYKQFLASTSLYMCSSMLRMLQNFAENRHAKENIKIVWVIIDIQGCIFHRLHSIYYPYGPHKKFNNIIQTFYFMNFWKSSNCNCNIHEYDITFLSCPHHMVKCGRITSKGTEWHLSDYLLWKKSNLHVLFYIHGSVIVQS